MVRFHSFARRSKLNRLLSKGRIFGRKSKRAQASQIYALKKKLFSYIKRTRPETKILQLSSYTVLNALTNTSGGGLGLISWQYPTSDTPFGAIQPTISGDFARLYNCLIEGVFRFTDTASEGHPISLRLVALQTTRTRSQDIQINDVFRRSVGSSSGPVDADTTTGNALAVYGPLQTGVSSLARILWDRVYTLQPNKVSSMKISMNLKRLVNLRLDSHGLADGSTSESIAQGRIYIFYAWSYPTNDVTQQNASLILNAKLAFPDN